MKKTISILMALAICSAWGCAANTTGDPTQGGLFGWSEAKAQARLEEKHRILDEEERRTRELGGDPYYYPAPSPPETTE